MAYKLTGLMLPGRQISTITETALLDDVEASSIAIYYGDTVDDNRQVEIIDAWKYLANGIRDRQLMNTFGGVIYSGVDIDDISEANRRTVGTIASFTANDVIVGVGQLVVAEWEHWVLPVEVGFVTLRQSALENTLKAA